MSTKEFLKTEVCLIMTTLLFAIICRASGTLPPDFRIFSSYNNPVVEMDFFASGYSDWMYWGYQEPRHPYPQHEMLSGEWGAAIYCDDVGTAQNTIPGGGHEKLPIEV